MWLCAYGHRLIHNGPSMDWYKGWFKMSTRFLRNKDLIDQDNLTDVCIIGAGGIGSFLLQGLTIMGWNDIIVWDSDDVAEHNLSSTAYPANMVGRPKIDAAGVLHSLYAGPEQTLTCYQRKWLPFESAHPRTIVCTDDMESRRNVFNKWSELDNKDFFIDGRMGATTVELATETNRVSKHTYMDEWIPTDSVPEAPCSMKHTVFGAQHIAAQIVAQVYNIVGNLAYYDYIHTSLSPTLVTFGNLIIPKTDTEE